MSSRSVSVLGGVLGAIAGAAQSFQPTLVPRSTLHQGLVTTFVATSGAGAGAAIGGVVGAGETMVLRRRAPDTTSQVKRTVMAAAIASATGIAAAFRGRQLREDQLENYAEWGLEKQTPELAAAVGLAVTGVIGVVATAAGTGVDRVGVTLSSRFWGPRPVWTLAAGVVTAGMASGLVTGTRRLVFARLAADSRAPDRALINRPEDTHVTGGPDSVIDYDSLSREGRRFVNWRVPAAEINESLDVSDAVESVRVFVGIDSASTVTERVDLAMVELDRLQAWDRSAILAISPAGSGYANSVPAEALELYRRGDCASVVVQYGLLPSMFSFSKLELASQTYRQLLDRIAERIASMPEEGRPLLFGYGESLGSLTAQHGMMAAPNLVDVPQASISKLDAVVFVGTPGGVSLRNELDGNPASVHVDQWQDLPASSPSSTQFWFLDHDADPVTRFTGHLVRREPRWLAQQPPRGRNIPDQMKWLPLATWEQVLFDVAYATQSQSGVFRSVGHDYRADLAPVVAAAFARGIDVDVPAVQQILADREVARDHLLTQAESDEPGS